MFPNSITLVLAGSWNNSPGDSRMNIATATTTGPQSVFIIFSPFLFFFLDKKQKGSSRNSNKKLSFSLGDAKGVLQICRENVRY